MEHIEKLVHIWYVFFMKESKTTDTAENYKDNIYEEYQLLKSIIENSPDAIQISDKNLVTVMVNRAYEVLTGIKREEQIGISVQTLVQKGLISKSCAAIVKRTKKSCTIIQNFPRTGRSAHVSCTPLYNKAGQIEYYICNDRDLNEINSLIKELETTKTLRDHYMNELALLKTNDALENGFIADDDKTRQVLSLSLKSAKVDSPVLLMGESGVGKTELAKLIHHNSKRADGEFISLNCASLSFYNSDNELFGAESEILGSKRESLGILDAANFGTLFLEGLEDFPLSMQAKLYNVIKNGSFIRSGGSKPVKVDIRFIAATNTDLSQRIQDKTFREDLFYQLNVISINVPPLRERQQDIIPLALHFLDIYNKRHKQKKEFSPGVLYSFLSHSWKGNIRELRNEIERAVLISDTQLITETDFKFKGTKNNRNFDLPVYDLTNGLHELLEKVEWQNLNKAYTEHGNIRAAAKSLKISASTFQRHLTALNKKYG